MALGDFLQRMTGGLGAQQAQQPVGGLGGGGMFGGLSRFNERHPGLVMGAGQLIAGNDIWPAIAHGQSVRKERATKAEKATLEGKTKAYLKRVHKMTDEDADAIIASGQAGAYFKPPKGADDTTYGLNPVWGKDAEGKDVLGVLGNDGTFKQIDTPGFKPSAGIEKVDLGTEWGFVNKRTGEMIRTEPKQNFQEAFDKADGTASGKIEGETRGTLDSMTSKMPGLEKVVQDLDGLAEKATYTAGGQIIDFANRQMGLEPREAAVARAQYVAMVDNQVLPMLRDTFGAAFTVKEGETLRATLGNPDASPKEKQAILRAFIEQKRRDIEAMGVQTGKTAPGTSGRLRYNPQTGELE